MVSIERIKELLGEQDTLSDEEAAKIRSVLYLLARDALDAYMSQKPKQNGAPTPTTKGQEDLLPSNGNEV